MTYLTQAPETTAGFWTYQRERFPLFVVIPLFAVFSASSVTASAHLADRPMPGLAAYAAAVTLAILAFWMTHVAGEIRDEALNRTLRPDHPVQRGIISLRTLTCMGAAAIALALAVAFAFDAFLLVPLGFVFIWVGLLATGFFAPKLMRAWPGLFLLAQSMIVPLVDLLVTACEWGPTAGQTPDGLWTFLLMSYANGCIVEVSDKTTSPVARRSQRGTYSNAWGTTGAVTVMGIASIVSYGCLVAYGAYMGMAHYFAEVGLIAGVPFICCLVCFAIHPAPAMEKTVAAACRLWIAGCYLIAAFLPFIWDR